MKEKQENINEILKVAAGGKTVEYPSIPIELWVVEEDEDNPDFQEWVRLCRQWCEAEEAATGRKDRDSNFAQYAHREYSFDK